MGCCCSRRLKYGARTVSVEKITRVDTTQIKILDMDHQEHHRIGTPEHDITKSLEDSSSIDLSVSTEDDIYTSNK